MPTGTGTKSRLELEKEKARAKAQRQIDALNKRVIGVLEDMNPDVLNAAFDAIDAEDAEKTGSHKDKIEVPAVKAKREIVASFTRSGQSLSVTPAASSSSSSTVPHPAANSGQSSWGNDDE